MTINELMVREGLARVDDKGLAGKFSELLTKLRSEEAAAKKGRYNIWAYGDTNPDDDHELGLHSH